MMSPLLALTRRIAPWRAAALVALVVSLVLAQWLGVVHGVAHADRHGGHALHGRGQVPDHAHLQAQAHAPLHGPASFSTQALFDDHDDEAQCRLYDQLAHADVALGASALALAPVVPGLAVDTHSTGHLAAQATGFLARAPPARG